MSMRGVGRRLGSIVSTVRGKVSRRSRTSNSKVETNHFATLGDVLMKRYVVDFVNQMKQPNLWESMAIHIPILLRCEECMGKGYDWEVKDGGGTAEKKMCWSCFGKGINPVPLSEVDGTVVPREDPSLKFKVAGQGVFFP